MPGFPAKKWFGKLRNDVVEKRRSALEKWLLLVLRHKQTLPVLLRFLQAFAYSAEIESCRKSAIITRGARNPESLPTTVQKLIHQSTDPVSSPASLHTLNALLSSENYEVRKTSVCEFLRQDISTYKRMQLHTRLLDPASRPDAVSVFAVLCDSGHFDRSQLVQIVSSRSVERIQGSSVSVRGLARRLHEGR